jgi:hypothetical protein
MTTTEKHRDAGTRKNHPVTTGAAAAPRGRVQTTPLNHDELRYLRKCVRYRLGLRKTLRDSQALHGLAVTPERAKYLRKLAITFTEKVY